MIKQRILGLAIVLGLTVPVAEKATASTVISGGITQVDVTADLTGLGLIGFPFGSATAADSVFSFPITGGSAIAPDDLLIEHDGSGVTLQALASLTTQATVANFLIDTVAGGVFGDVIGGANDVFLFEFGSGDDLPGIELEITSQFATALTSVFGAPDLTGATFGYASTSPDLAPVPLPAGLPLLLGGMAILFGLRRRNQAS
ncbi:hypothetical protein [uncultured Shimia sp.]|uniref:hypothetical protein n=1 Tax=uncultured Shimia sp. TaxID=573152 RepID=UPI00261560B0|nr:hypothetical protein [uncultured Shimia sp.]